MVVGGRLAAGDGGDRLGTRPNRPLLDECALRPSQSVREYAFDSR
jgi:hypothetical protein